MWLPGTKETVFPSHLEKISETAWRKCHIHESEISLFTQTGKNSHKLKPPSLTAMPAVASLMALEIPGISISTSAVHTMKEKSSLSLSPVPEIGISNIKGNRCYLTALCIMETHYPLTHQHLIHSATAHRIVTHRDGQKGFLTTASGIICCD